MLHGTLPCSEAARTERRRSRGRGVRRHGARTRRRSNGPTSPSRRRLDGVLTHHPCSATRDGGCHVIVLVTKIVPLIEDGDEGGSAGAKHGGRLIKYRARVDSRASERGRRVWRQRGDVARCRRFGAGREVTREMAEPFAGTRRPQGATRGAVRALTTPWRLRFQGDLQESPPRSCSVAANKFSTLGRRYGQCGSDLA